MQFSNPVDNERFNEIAQQGTIFFDISFHQVPNQTEIFKVKNIIKKENKYANTK
jgi:hypothetical protein